MKIYEVDHATYLGEWEDGAPLDVVESEYEVAVVRTPNYLLAKDLWDTVAICFPHGTPMEKIHETMIAVEKITREHRA